MPTLRKEDEIRRQELIQIYKENSNTRLGVNENVDLDGIGVFATRPIKKGEVVCILPPEDLYPIGETITVTAEDLKNMRLIKMHS